MNRLLRSVVVLIVVCAALSGILAAHTYYGSLWLDGYLVLLVALPLVLAVLRASARTPRWSIVVQSTFPIIVSLLATTLVYRNNNHDWTLAVLIGSVTFIVIWYIRQRSTLQANSKLRQATQAMNKNGNLRRALVNLQDANEIYQKTRNSEKQAMAEWYMGTIHIRNGNHKNAARPLNNALRLFRASGDQQKATQVAETLAQLQRRGINITPENQSKDTAMHWGLLLDSVVLIGGLDILSWLWNVLGQGQGTWPILIGLGVVLLIYGIVYLFTRPVRTAAHTALVLIAYNLVLVIFLASGSKFWSGSQSGQTVNLSSSPTTATNLTAVPTTTPTNLTTVPTTTPTNLTTVPTTTPTASGQNWLVPAIIGGVLVLVLIVGLVANRRLRSVFGSRRRRQLLAEAAEQMKAKNWSQAITTLLRIDVTRETDVNQRKAILFYLALAHYMDKQTQEASNYIKDALALDDGFKEGLYLSGHLALQSNQLDEAEEIWRKLVKSDPAFRPDGPAGETRDAQYYLCLTLYRRSMEKMKQKFEEGVTLLAEAGSLGSLDEEIAEILVRVHLYRCTQHIRQHKWDMALDEVGVAQQKLQLLRKSTEDQPELKKLAGICAAARAIVFFRQERYREVENNLLAAERETEGLVGKSSLDFSARPGVSLLEQLVQAVLEKQREDAEKLSPLFSRDLFFLGGVIYLHALAQQVNQQQNKVVNWPPMIKKAQGYLERALSLYPDFDEGRVLLGLLFYYLETDKARQTKGIELLNTVRSRIRSSFIQETLSKHDSAKNQREDARNAYFDTLEQYLQFSNVPRADRETLRKQAIHDMESKGELKQLMGKRKLEIANEREHEPTVEEFRQQANLLREKMKQLAQQRPEVRELIDKLTTHNETLQKLVKEIGDTERSLLAKAHDML